MHFCPKCGNMYYLRLTKDADEQENALIYYCRKCGNEDDSLVSNLNNLYVSKTNIKKTTNYKNINNKYTKLHPTLPRITNIDCPNQDCDSNRKDDSKEDKEDKEILYIRYDDTNMKFIYLCSICDTIWDTKTK